MRALRRRILARDTPTRFSMNGHTTKSSGRSASEIAKGRSACIMHHAPSSAATAACAARHRRRGRTGSPRPTDSLASSDALDDILGAVDFDPPALLCRFLALRVGIAERMPSRIAEMRGLSVIVIAPD